MNLFIIPTSNVPQTFTIELANVEYDITIKWNDELYPCWIMDIADTNSGLSLVAGIPLITGADLLEQYPYLQIGGMIVYTDGDQFAPPNLVNFGTESNLYFLTESDDE